MAQHRMNTPPRASPSAQPGASTPPQAAQQPVADSASPENPNMLSHPPQLPLPPSSDSPSKEVHNPESPPPRISIHLQQMSGNTVVTSTFLQAHASLKDAWSAAESLAASKKAELEEKAKLAGNPTPNVDVYMDATRCTLTVSVDYLFRWRYQIDHVVEHASAQAQTQRESAALRERQDTPAQAIAAEDVVQSREERGGAPSAALAGAPMASRDEGKGDSNSPSSVRVDPQNGLDEAVIDIPAEPTTSDFEGDTVADEDSVYGSNMDRVEVTNEAGPQPTEEDTTAPQEASENDDARTLDTSAAHAPDVVVAPNTETQAVPSTASASASTTTSQQQQHHSTPHFGLYLSVTGPASPTATYRIHLTHSRGQAETDMKLLASNELTKALAEGTAHTMRLEMGSAKIGLARADGTRLEYEICEGEFDAVDGEFRSERERAGGVGDGARYAREMFEAAFATTGEEGSEREADMREEAQDEEGVDEAETAETPASRKRSRSPNEGQHTDEVVCEEADGGEAAGAAPPAKKRRVESPRAGRIESHDKSADEQQPTPIALHAPVKKRAREPEDATPAADAASEVPPSKRPRREGLRGAAAGKVETESATVTTKDETPAEEAEDPDALYCRCKQPDDGRQMFFCDAEHCPNNGWVHMACFPEMEVEPEDDGGESKWYCADCEHAAVAKDGVADQKAGGKKVGVAKKKGAAKKASETKKKGTGGKAGETQKKGAGGKAGVAKKKPQSGGRKKTGSAANKRKLIR